MRKAECDDARVGRQLAGNYPAVERRLTGKTRASEGQNWPYRRAYCAATGRHVPVSVFRNATIASTSASGNGLPT